ncbi:MAG: TonB-dependent receptor [Candidatus Marinimicrobia bacterium]|nr:TonB-dependent receptor [Candidatus Neomarinimicrobiota bacterium]
MDKIWTVTNKIYWDSFTYDCFWEYLPASILPPNGYITDAYARDYKLGVEITAEAKFSEKHRLLIGGLNDYIGITGSWAEHNLPDYGYQYSEVPGSWISNGKDKNYGFYLQDNYFFTDRTQVVAGIRYDNHTAYGDSWNPRCGITRKIGQNGHAKLLYGQAFRAPTNWDLYSNSADQVKNPDLAPEKIQTLELEMYYMIFQNFISRINFYHNEIYDLILKSLVIVNGRETSIKDNLGKIEVNGIEAELNGKIFSDQHEFNLNFFYNQSRDTYLNRDMHYIPDYGAVFYINNQWFDRFSTHLQIKHVGEVSRKSEDTRAPLSPVTSINLIASLNYRKVVIKGGIYNLTDTKIFTPSPMEYQIDDFPQPGRNYMISLEFSK